jgi:hypothetical protein
MSGMFVKFSILASVVHTGWTQMLGAEKTVFCQQIMSSCPFTTEPGNRISTVCNAS